MKFLEHEAKRRFRKAGIRVPDGVLVVPGQAFREPGPGPWFVKAQVTHGGRGKSGLVRRIDDIGDLPLAVTAVSDEASTNNPVLVEPAIRGIERYISVGIDAARGSAILTVGSAGGVDVESAPPSSVATRSIQMARGVLPHDAVVLAKSVGIRQQELASMSRIAVRLWRIFLDESAELIEINPLIWPGDNHVAADAKLVTFEQETSDSGGVVFFERPGSVAIMSGGAGLGMALSDMLTHLGAPPANFADVVGGVTAARIDELANRVLERTRAESVRALVLLFTLSHTPIEVPLRTICAAFEAAPPEVPVVGFLSGGIPGDAAEAEHYQDRLRNLGVELVDSIEELVQRAAAHARSDS